jgi:predicted O-methyltransferase YrrM
MTAASIDPAARRRAVESVEALPGWLLEGDAAALYDLAHGARGPILEVGTYRGKSTVLMATALRDAGLDGPVVSLDVDAAGLREAAAELSRGDLADRVVLVRGTAQALLRVQRGFTPAFVFLDGDHSRRGVARDLRALRDRVPAGAPILLHDYHDARNADPAEPDYGVPQAVADSWVAADCELEGVYGCSGLFVRRAGPPREPDQDGLVTGGEIVELGREPLRSWFDRRVLGAMDRRLRR